MPPVRITSRTAKFAGGTVIVWSAAVGAYVFVETVEIAKDPGNTNRDLAPTAAFALSSVSSDTGIIYDVTIAENIMDTLIRFPQPEKPKVTQGST